MEMLNDELTKRAVLLIGEIGNGLVRRRAVNYHVYLLMSREYRYLPVSSTYLTIRREQEGNLPPTHI